MNKTILTLFLVLVFTSTGSAIKTPFNKGSITLGGTMYLQSQISHGSSQTQIMIAPEFGIFVSPGLMIGGNLFFWNYPSYGDRKVSIYGFGPGIGYYFNINKFNGKIKGSLIPYIKAYLNFTGYSENSNIIDRSIAGIVGMNYMMSDAIALDIGLRISADTRLYGSVYGSSTTTTIWIGAGIAGYIY